MAIIKDRYDNLLDDHIYKQWCKKLGLKPVAPSSHTQWKKGVLEGTIFLAGGILFDNSNPHNPIQIMLEAK